jgi:phage shock protein A
MSLLRKFFTQIKGALHDLLDTFSDAGRTARQGVREIDEQIREAEEGVTDVAAELKLMEHERDRARDDGAKWGRVAASAAQRGQREDAVEAVQQQVLREEAAAGYDAQVQRLSPMLAQLKARLSQLRQVRADAQNKTALLDARSKVAKAESRAARYLGNVGKGGGVDFDELERKVDREEAKASSLADMAQEKAALKVDDRLSAYSRQEAIAGKLAELGMLPAAEAPVALSIPAIAAVEHSHA